MEILLNGVDTGVGLPAFTGTLTPFSLPVGANFVSVINTLAFSVNNFAGGPTGLRVEISGTAAASAVPEPGSIALLVTSGLSGAVFLLRKRRRK